MRYSPHPPAPCSLTWSRGGRRRFGVLMLSEAPLPLRERGWGCGQRQKPYTSELRPWWACGAPSTWRGTAQSLCAPL